MLQIIAVSNMLIRLSEEYVRGKKRETLNGRTKLKVRMYFVWKELSRF